MFDAWFWIWAILALILFVGEIFTAGFFMLPFGLGAAIAALLAYLQIEPVWQMVGFIAVSAVAFSLLRNVAERLTHDPPQKTGVDRLIGKHGVVTEEIVPDSSYGQVWVEREEWRADAPGSGRLVVDTAVEILGVEGSHLVVRPIED